MIIKYEPYNTQADWDQPTHFYVYVVDILRESERVLVAIVHQEDFHSWVCVRHLDGEATVGKALTREEAVGRFMLKVARES